MANFDVFKDHIRMLGTRQREALAGKRDEHRKTMDEEDEWRRRFDEAASTLFAEVVQPHLSFLSGEVEGVTYEYALDIHHGTLNFNQDERYAATIRLHVSVEPDGQRRLAIVLRLEIIPLLTTVSPARLEVSLGQIDNDAVEQFLQESIVRFLETYESLQNIPGYRQPGCVKDPVCGMELNRADAVAKEKCLGRTFYFCVPECRRRFLENPELYARRA